MSKPRPPLGVMPQRLWAEVCPEPDLDDLVRRYTAVSEAVQRAREAGVAPMQDWLVELGITPPQTPRQRLSS